MKTCTSCAEQIQDEARVCPYCRRATGPDVSKAIGAILLAAFIAGCIYYWPAEPNNTTNLIVTSKQACEAQTGKPCSVP